MSERQFNVILTKLKLAYAEMSGIKALRCMLAFEKKFIETVAITSANEIVSVLTLEQIAPMFIGVGENVDIPESWKSFLE